VKLGKKTIALLGLPLGVGLAGGLIYMFVLAGPSKPAEIPGPDTAQGQHGVMIPLEEKVVNLLKGGDYRYAKIGLTVEVRPDSADFYALKGEARAAAEKEAVKGYDAAMPLLLDALGRTVGARTSNDLGTPDGRQMLKDGLLAEIRKVLGANEVLDVYFTDLVMQ